MKKEIIIHTAIGLVIITLAVIGLYNLEHIKPWMSMSLLVASALYFVIAIFK